MTQATQKTSEHELNELNGSMRAQPWYQQYFQTRGLNPNQVKLDGRQRQELAQLANRNGYQIGDRMKIDEAGNINQMGGYAGMPTWAKVAIAAAPAAATAGFGMAGMGPMAGMFGGGGSAASGAAGAAGMGMTVPELGIDSLASVLGGGAGGGAAISGATLPTLASTAYGPSAGAVTPTLAGLGTVNGAANGARNAGSVISRLLGDGGQNAADIGSMFERFGNDEARNILNNFEMNNRYNRDMVESQQDRRLQESDAMKKIQQAGYIKSGGVPFDASQVKLAGGRELPSFNFPRSPITDEAKQAAGMLEKSMLERLGPNGSFTPAPVSNFTDRGTMENIGRFGSYGSSAMGALDNFGLMDDVGRGIKTVGKSIWDIFT